MKKILTIIAILFAVSLTLQANALRHFDSAQCPQGSVAEVTEALEVLEATDEFVEIKIEDLPENVQKAIRRTLYEEGFMLRQIFQHKENKDIKVIGVSNEASVVTFLFDKNGKEKE
jgi:hypothetical protein